MKSSCHDELRQNDIIRVDHNNEDVNLSVVKLYDREGNLINRADRVCYIRIKEKLAKGDLVYKTKDYLFYKELEQHMDGEFRRFPLSLRVYAYPGAHLTVDAEGLGVQCFYESKEILEAAENHPTTIEQVKKQFAKLNDTVFTLQNLEFEECGAFLPVKMINQARREIVDRLYEKKINNKPRQGADGNGRGRGADGRKRKGHGAGSGTIPDGFCHHARAVRSLPQGGTDGNLF